ncbi:hypothetical protein [Halapricum hydrolyticum]|uniref:Uncharacterized protein n=1 Tax=Halapricum hydrolyticum TaxID=2979991 RepID=A0AAE3LF06_9EURY|nr:hypothetical protein [Halapricum hydrolyticum]MCU4717886.1 hypothetical protein [Halapricum hydrolyticum]MCU4727051.1 hypothetical protein [Halapricum hydrolyticum]
MSSDNRETTSSDPHLTTGPIDIGNREYLDLRLPELREKFAYEELSGLSKERLKQEESNLIRDFTDLRNRFPHSDYLGNDDKALQRIQMGDDFRGLSTLTSEQKQRIYDCKGDCYRNIDRAITEAVEREKASGLTARFGTWLNEFVDNLTPLFVIKW